MYLCRYMWNGWSDIWKHEPGTSGRFSSPLQEPKIIALFSWHQSSRSRWYVGLRCWSASSHKNNAVAVASRFSCRRLSLSSSEDTHVNAVFCWHTIDSPTQIQSMYLMHKYTYITTRRALVFLKLAFPWTEHPRHMHTPARGIRRLVWTDILSNGSPLPTPKIFKHWHMYKYVHTCICRKLECG